MDLERENSGLESVSDNEAIAENGNLESHDDVFSKIENKGTIAAEHGKVEAVRDVAFANLMPVMVTRSSDSGSPLVSPGTTAKGKGLRKWRRIKREATKEGNSNVDNIKLLKRGLSNVAMQPGKPAQFSSEMRRSSEGSVSSSNDGVRYPVALLDGFVMMDDSGLTPVFEAEGESENKEDDLYSTTNVPKMRGDRPVIAGHVNDRDRAKSSAGNISNGSVQKVQQGKKMTGTSKKLRRGQISIEKQNSYPSMESDSRSSNVVLMQDNNSVASRESEIGGLKKYAGRSDQAHQQANDRFQTSRVSNNGTEFEDVSQREMSAGSNQGVEEENWKKQEYTWDQEDPLNESFHMLQSVQEALEKEVQRFREVGNEDILVNESRPSEWTSVNSEVNDQSSSGEDDDSHSIHALKSEISSLKENAHLMISNLEEITALLKAREADINELEARLDSKSLNEDMEAELESMYRQKIEAEVKYVTLIKTIQDLRVASVDKMSILEQKTASDKSEILNNLGYAESKAVQLKRDAEKLESYLEDVCPDETMKLQNNICKYTFCFLIQLILLIVILGILISQLSPNYTEVVPT